MLSSNSGRNDATSKEAAAYQRLQQLRQKGRRPYAAGPQRTEKPTLFGTALAAIRNRAKKSSSDESVDSRRRIANARSCVYGPSRRAG
ncbi:unnamed protein product [Rangifer tarandus platyrhynchus]|uniref:Uncharacterized protein n=1 Tax=Rangifer tarandus platyrhynchus TaxID=3082113 RepID=A0ABN8XKS6_RANTA|nr:unnamed protein product [Rangifer tarandus platyrhynchus]